MNNMNQSPYYAVIFTSQRNSDDDAGYEEMTNKMMALTENRKGFRGIESVRGTDGKGITVSYWETLEDIKAWKKDSEHLEAQRLGRSKWYSEFKVRICKVEREY